MKVRQGGKVRLGGKENDTKGKGMIGRQRVQQGGEKYDTERKRKKIRCRKVRNETYRDTKRNKQGCKRKT